MPIYDYKCPECDYELDDWIADIDHKPPKCFTCDTVMVQQLSPPHIEFRGQGWTPNSGIVRRK